MSLAETIDPGYPLRVRARRAPMRKFLPVLCPQEQVLEQHRDRLLRYVMSMIHDRGESEDLLQEICRGVMVCEPKACCDVAGGGGDDQHHDRTRKD